jgi:hypothetical protein
VANKLPERQRTELDKSCRDFMNFPSGNIGRYNIRGNFRIGRRQIHAPNRGCDAAGDARWLWS